MRPSGTALLLSQVGAHVQTAFADAVGELGLTPAHVSVLRVVGQEPGLNQQAVAARLGVVPSKVVGLVDDLEQRGLVVRERDATDRRQYALRVSPAAADGLRRVREVVAAHDRRVTAALDPEEVAMLVALLGKVARSLGLPGGPGG